MPLLYFFEQLRNPVLDFLMLMITHLGEEMVFMGVAMLFLWCVDKYEGYYLLTIGFLGTQINQLLKVTFRIERPWVRDPDFTVVESAVPEATGYSFPSGHTQGAVGNFGGIARWTHRRWVRVVCIVICLLVPLSRMYLGVHTPWDVGVSLLLAAVLVFALYPLLRKVMQHPKWMKYLLWAMLAWSVGQILYMEFFPFPADADGAELFSALENAYKMAGAVLGFAIAYELDERLIHYQTGAVWWAQLLKWLIGLLLSLGVKEGVYLLCGVLPDDPLIKGAAYCLMVLFAGAVWPLTFRWFAALGKKNKEEG
ncbi:MAG: hypothetical protein DBX52_00735 [Clostridiales bacterium]|nr:MAG: hypothetical protein DBX52_00735 [Clostridiales bacterium]